jgi:hypothetical protein
VIVDALADQSTQRAELTSGLGTCMMNLVHRTTFFHNKGLDHE